MPSRRSPSLRSLDALEDDAFRSLEPGKRSRSPRVSRGQGAPAAEQRAHRARPCEPERVVPDEQLEVTRDHDANRRPRPGFLRATSRRQLVRKCGREEECMPAQRQAPFEANQSEKRSRSHESDLRSHFGRGASGSQLETEHGHEGEKRREHARLINRRHPQFESLRPDEHVRGQHRRTRPPDRERARGSESANGPTLALLRIQWVTMVIGKSACRL